MLEKSISLSSMTKEDAHKLFIDFKDDKSLFEREEDYYDDDNLSIDDSRIIDEAKIVKEDL